MIFLRTKKKNSNNCRRQWFLVEITLLANWGKFDGSDVTRPPTRLRARTVAHVAPPALYPFLSGLVFICPRQVRGRPVLPCVIIKELVESRRVMTWQDEGRKGYEYNRPGEF